MAAALAAFPAFAAVVVAAVRLRAHDPAVGSLFGSNALNMALFAPLELAARDGALLAAVDDAHVPSALVGIARMTTGLAAIVYRARRRLPLHPTAMALLGLHVGGLLPLFRHATGR